MALIKTAAELRSVLPQLLSNLSNTANLPPIDKAQRKYIRPLLGKAFLDDIEERYEDNTLGDDEDMLKYIQLPLAAYAILDNLAFIQSTITDSGIRTMSTDKMQAAHRWEYNEIRNSLEDTAIAGVEQLLDYLYEKQTDYALWTGSDEFKELDSFLIKTGIDFAKQYPLYQPYYTYWALKPVMRDAEENYLASRLGRDLLAWVKGNAEIEIEDSSGILDVKRLLKKAIAFLTIKHACEHYNTRFDKNGFTIVNAGGSPEDQSSTGRTAASQSETEKRKQVCDRDGQNYLNKAAYYLKGMGEGKYGDTWLENVAFMEAFNHSPLKKDPKAPTYTRGNERRNIFRL